METSSSSSSSSSSSGTATIHFLLQALSAKGWCFGDVDQVKPLIENQLSLRGNACTVDSVESELLNLDLRSIGGKSLPDSSTRRKASHHFQSPKVLQVSSVRDISQSSIADSSGNSKNNRLLRFKLTDGHSEITAVEYSPIPSLSDDVVPGTKVLLENKTVMHYGIICLNTKTITVLGGVVQSLYEEWQTNRKYSGFSRSTLRQSDESAAEGPPPFEKLQIGARSQQLAQLSKSSQYSKSSYKSLGSAPAGKGESSNSRQMDRLQTHGSANFGSDVKPHAKMESIEEKTISSEGRPKEVVESVPVQNQAAAQKLLQKMTQPSHGVRGPRSRRHRGKDREEDSQFLTLDEWERKKAGEKLSTTHEMPNVSQDEDLARQLQEQFDLEDIHVQKDSHVSEAENLRMSMFSFERDDSSTRGRTGFRGRGRGRGRGRRGGRRGS